MLVIMTVLIVVREVVKDVKEVVLAHARVLVIMTVLRVARVGVKGVTEVVQARV
jgi:hypothetical protein